MGVDKMSLVFGAVECELVIAMHRYFTWLALCASFSTLAQDCTQAPVLASLEITTIPTGRYEADGSLIVHVSSGDPIALILTDVKAGGVYERLLSDLTAVAPGSYQAALIDADGCLSNALNLMVPYSICCDCGVSDADTDGICDDIDNCTDPSASNYSDPTNTPCLNEDTPCLDVELDGYVYSVVEIGDQCWFAENLQTTIYANGDLIPAGLNDSDWILSEAGATSVFGEGNSSCEHSSPNIDACDESQSLAVHGRLYNWYAIQDGRGLCPTGWHVPSDDEWTILEGYVASQGFAEAEGLIGSEGTALKSNTGWSNNGNGADAFGFSARPGGGRSLDGWFSFAGNYGYWWSSSPYGDGAMLRVMNSTGPLIYRGSFNSHYGFSVRCLRDAE